MKKYTSRETRLLGVITSICGVILLAGIILSFLKFSTASFTMILFGGLLGLLFLCVFLADKSRTLVIDTEKIIFPRGADKNGKIVLQKTTVKFDDIISVDSKLYKGNGLDSKDAFFHTISLKDGTKITVTLYAYGKEAENEILEIIRKSIA